MSNWLLRVAEDWLEPIYKRLHEQLCRHEVLHADETTLQVLHEPGKKAQSNGPLFCDGLLLTAFKPATTD